jgi:hypothetical protein
MRPASTTHLLLVTHSVRFASDKSAKSIQFDSSGVKNEVPLVRTWRYGNQW